MNTMVWLPPMLTILGMLIVVVFTAWLNTRAVTATIDTGVAVLNGRINTLEERIVGGFKAVDVRLDGIDKRLDGIDKRMDGMHADVRELRADLKTVKR